jgi:hypothetical protein
MVVTMHHDGCGGILMPMANPEGWLYCYRCKQTEPIAPDPLTTLSDRERARLVAWVKHVEQS